MTTETERTELLDPLEMLLDAARWAEGNGSKYTNLAWAKAAREAVKQARLAQPAPVEQAGEVVAWQMRTVDGIYCKIIPDGELELWKQNWSHHLKSGHAQVVPLYTTPQPTPGFAEGFKAKQIDYWADWLVDAVAGATQNRMFLRGEPEEDTIATGAILANGKKAIKNAIASLRSTAAPEGPKEVTVDELATILLRLGRDPVSNAFALLSKFTITPKVQS